MTDLIHGRALSFFETAHPAGGRLIRFRKEAFAAEVLRHACGIPLLSGHHYARHVGTVRQMWIAPLGLYFSATLNGPHAALGRRLVQEGVQLSIAGLFSTTRAFDGVEDVATMYWLQELSLVQQAASRNTWTKFGKPSGAPMRPITWWRGTPPLPPSLSPAIRAKALRRLQYKARQGQVHEALERVGARYDRVEAALVAQARR